MNKFEQVSSDHHQMSLAGVPPGLMFRGVPGLMLVGREGGTLPDHSGAGGGVPHHVAHPMMHLMLPIPP